MSAQYRYDNTKYNNAGRSSTSYSELKNTSNYNCNISCICPANLNMRTSYDQMMYKKWVNNGEAKNIENFSRIPCIYDSGINSAIPNCINSIGWSR